MINLIFAGLFTYLAYRKWGYVHYLIDSTKPDSVFFLGYCFLAGLFWGGVINWIL